MATKVTLTKDQLTKAAKLRDEGKSWNAIREALGVKWGSSKFFAAWTDAGIKHRPPNTAKATNAATDGSEPAKPSAKPAATATKAANPKATVKVKRTPQKAASKPLEGAKPRTQTATKGHPRTSDGKTEPVVTNIDEAIKDANARGAKVTPNGGQVTKEQVQANWDSLSAQEQEGFASMGWAPAQPKVVA